MTVPERELLIIADTETTGLSLKTDRVCQFGIVGAFINREDRDIEFFVIADELCRPDDLVIPDEASKIHGVTNEMVANCAPDYEVISKSWKAAMDVVLEFETEFPEGAVALAGYNTDKFDWPLLSNIHPPIKEAIQDPAVPRVDGLPLARRLHKGRSHKLGAMFEHLFNTPAVDAHNAAADCIMTGRVIARMLCDANMSLRDAVTYAKTPVLLEHMPFGKHEGVRFEEIPISYIRWCHNNWTDIDMDLLHTFKHHLKTRNG